MTSQGSSASSAQASSPATDAPLRIQRPLGIVLRGIAMGAADIVPGVSGGTIAFVTGIYLRLLTALGDMPPALLQLLRDRKLSRFWWRIDGNFLLLLFAGILFSVLSLARLISYLMLAQPIALWSFFFGLVLASAWHVGRQIPRWRLVEAVWMILGAAAALMITRLSPTEIPMTAASLFFSGMLAICAMILPGISGSFILLLLGIYAPLLAAVKAFDVASLAFFASGCLIGLLSSARLIAAGMRRYPGASLALLTGFMLGALNKLWPWKLAAPDQLDAAKNTLVYQVNVSPMDYAVITGQSDQWVAAGLLLCFGALMVLLIEWAAARKPKK